MAKQGEEWVKSVLETQGYKTSKMANEDTLAFFDKLLLIVEEKDNKYPIKTTNTRVYSVAGKTKRYPFRLYQIKQQTQDVLAELRNQKKFFNIIRVCVVSRMIGRYVGVVRHYKGEIFFVNKVYFPIWLKYLKFVYLGANLPLGEGAYMGGV